MWTFLKETVGNFLEDECPRMAAAISYYTVFSLPALLVLVVLLLGLVMDPGNVEGRIESEIGSIVGPEGAAAIRTMIRNANRPGSGGVLSWILGGGALLFGATGAFRQLQAALNRAWQVEPAPGRGVITGFLLKRAISLGMVVTLAFLLLVSLVLSAVISAAGAEIAAFVPGGLSTVALRTLDTSASILVFTLLFLAIFVILPDADIAWKDATYGALATALLFVGGKFLISLYIGRSDPGSAYGAAGSLAVVLIWVYLSSLLVLLGAEVTQVLARTRGRAIRPESHAVRSPEHSRHEDPATSREGA